MTPLRNRQWRIAARPIDRMVVPGDFIWAGSAARAPDAGEVLVRTLYLGFDPSLKSQMENRSYAAPLAIGDVMRGRGIGEVVQSRDPAFEPGDKVTGFLDWQDYATLPGAALLTVPDDDLLTANLGVLGPTGLTAYVGMRHIGMPFPGDTVLIIGAAGATGSIAGQIAKIAGCRVIGIAGGPAKCARLIEEFGFDEAIDYKAGGVADHLFRMAPDGIDVLWDNVGGALLNEALAHIALNARIVICGGISRYTAGELPAGPENYFRIVFQRAKMQGFILRDYAPEFPLARERLRQWMRDGRIRHAEDIQDGLENAPVALMRLFEGTNQGKQLLRVARSDQMTTNGS